MVEQDVEVLAQPGFEQPAEALARQLQLPVSKAGSSPKGNPAFFLQLSERGLSLHQTGAANKGIQVDFLEGGLRYRRLYGGGKSQQIAKAAGVGASKFNPTILDLTAGLGRDAFVLASLGARVTLCERNPVIHALLEDGLARAERAAESSPDLSRIVARMKLVLADGLSFLEQLEADGLPDVIYLDPMFPMREKSAKVKKEMAIFHAFLGREADGGMLLEPSLAKARYRVVVKRPAHAPFLAAAKPSYSLKGSSTRFDIYTIRKMSKA